MYWSFARRWHPKDVPHVDHILVDIGLRRLPIRVSSQLSDRVDVVMAGVLFGATQCVGERGASAQVIRREVNTELIASALMEPSLRRGRPPLVGGRVSEQVAIGLLSPVHRDPVLDPLGGFPIHWDAPFPLFCFG